MTKRLRPVFSPDLQVNRLEKIVAASSITDGGLVTAAAAIVIDHGAVAAPPDAPPERQYKIYAAEHQGNGSPPPGSLKAIRHSNGTIDPSQAADHADSGAGEQPASELRPQGQFAGGSIRPLSASPAHQPYQATPAQTNLRMKSLGAGTGAGVGGRGAPSVPMRTGPEAGVGRSAPVVQKPGASINAAASPGFASGPDAPNAPISSNASIARDNSVAAHIAALNSIAKGLQDRPAAFRRPSLSGSDLLAKGYMPSGSMLLAPHANADMIESDAGVMGTGTGLASGATASVVGGTATSGNTASTPGNWSISVPNSSGGSTQYFGTISIQQNGGAYVGSAANFKLVLTGNVGTPTTTETTWSATGLPEMYDGQTVPNPKALSDPLQTEAPSTPSGGTNATKFQQPTYVLPASTENKKEISFDWGETPGLKTIVVTATITIDNGVHSTTATASRKAKTISPTLTGSIYYLKAAQIYQGKLYYMSDHGAKFGAGAGAVTIPTGVVNGIDWGNLSVGTPGVGAPGNIAVEQIVDTTSFFTWTSTGAPPIQHRYGFRNISPSNVVTAASLPLLDIPKGRTTPFYTPGTNWIPESVDSPNAPLVPFTPATTVFSVQMDLKFKDYIMFQPVIGGIWVPLATFNWRINATASPNGAGGWNVTAAVATCSTITVDHTAWPTSWNDLGYKYKQNASV